MATIDDAGGDHTATVAEVVAFYEGLMARDRGDSDAVWRGSYGRSPAPRASTPIKSAVSSVWAAADEFESALKRVSAHSMHGTTCEDEDDDDDDDLSDEIQKLRESEEELRVELESVDLAAMWEDVSDLSTNGQDDQGSGEPKSGNEDAASFFESLLRKSSGSTITQLLSEDSAGSAHALHSCAHDGYGYEFSYFAGVARKRDRGGLILQLNGRLPKIIVGGKRRMSIIKKKPSPFFEVALREGFVRRIGGSPKEGISWTWHTIYRSYPIIKSTNPAWDKIEVALPWPSLPENANIPIKICVYNSDRRRGNHKLIGSFETAVGSLISYGEAKTFPLMRGGKSNGRIRVQAVFVVGAV